METLLHNRVKVEALIEEHRPDAFGLSEAKLKREVDINDVSIKKTYTLHTAPTINNNNLNISRIVVYTSNNVIAKRRHDLEDENLAVILLEVGLPRKKKFLLANIYREWKFMGQNDDTSASIKAQLKRWNVFLDSWERALSEDKEVSLIGDVNLDFLKWKRNDLPPQ